MVALLPWFKKMITVDIDEDDRLKPCCMTYGEFKHRLENLGVADDMIVGCIYVTASSYESDLNVIIDSKRRIFFIR